MKRIVIVTKQMVIGGIENSLIHLLHELQNEDYEIYLFLEKEGGGFRKLLPTKCNVSIIPKINSSALSHIKRVFFKNGFFSAIQIGKKIIKNRLGVSYYQECKNVSEILPDCNINFDIAIAYSTPISLSTLYVVNNINAKIRILFIHNEVDKLGIDIEEAIECFKKYNKICCVSSIAKQILIEKFPELKSISFTFNNIINKQLICSLAEKGNKLERKENIINILTVGRLSKEKGQEIIPQIALLLKKIGIGFKWFIVGSGPLKDKILKEIRIRQVDQYVELIGETTNPYGYFQSCDIYVQTSKQEGYGITLTEAKCFAKPIITTNFAGAHDQIENGVNGLIVNFSVKEIADAIYKIVQESQLREQFHENLISFQPNINHQKQILSEVFCNL